MCINNIEIAQTIQLFVSSFLGFLSALLVEWLSEVIRSKKSAIQLEKQIKKEVNEILNTAYSLEDQMGYINPYRVSVWNLSIQTGEILGLSQKKYYNEMIKAFNQVEEANRIETEFYKYLMEIDLIESNSKKTDDILDKIYIQQKNVRNDLVFELKKLTDKWG